METKINIEGNDVTAILAGRLDTLQAPGCEAALAPVHENADKNVIIECEGLEYISSSGLRILLGILKAVKAKGGTLALRHVNKEVRNIFAITGFHKLFNIQN